MKIIETNIADVKIIETQIFGDERGFFMETWSQRSFQQEVANCLFVQDNHCLSKRGSLRGLHYQTEQPQGKLVR
ncbi:MAG: dTDP-4-dehydrorhamnose 3,5-epimerase family protein, partial [Shewanella sp.]